MEPVQVQVYPPTQPIKAIYAAVTTFLSQLIAVMVAEDGSRWPTSVSWLTIILSTIVVTGGVYGLTNGPVHRTSPPVGNSVAEEG